MIPFFGEPTVRVGLASGSGFGINLHGEYDISASEDSILYTPLTPDSFVEVKGIAIGKGFHWQRTETELFPGRMQLLRHGEATHLINILPVEQYLKSVVSSEMNAESPLEFLKAHAIISRSWLMRILTRVQTLPPTQKSKSESKIITWTDNEAHNLYDVCADDHCQRYHGMSRQNEAAVKAVEDTCGMVLTDCEGTIADARFSKCCGGTTEVFSTCWQDHNPHYLQSVADSYCNPRYLQGIGQSHILNDFDIDTKDYYQWQETIPKQLIAENLNKQFNINIGKIVNIEPLGRGKSGRISLLKVIGEVRSIEIGKELAIRKLLSKSCLKSSAFDIISSDDESFTIEGKGWGHGVGLCQIGAAVMAVTGRTYPEILTHYYPGTRIEKLY